MYSMKTFMVNIIRKRPVHLTFFVTNRCNARCRMCFYWKQLNKKEDELSLEEIEKFSKKYGRIMWLLLSGGEPFIRDDIVEICKIFYDNNKPVNITIPTNGILSKKIYEDTKKIASYCKNSRITVKLSLDGLGETHDYMRGVMCFDKVMETHSLLKKLKNKNLEIGFNAVICKSNLDKLGEIFDFLEKKGGYFTFSIARGDTRLTEKISVEQVEKFMKKMIKYISERKGKDFFEKMKLKQDILQKELIMETMKSKKRVIPCYAGRINLVLVPNGDVYPCELMDVKIGNIKNYDYNIHKLLKAKKKKLEIFYKTKCFCSHECYFMTNILFNPKLYPRLLSK